MKEVTMFHHGILVISLLFFGATAFLSTHMMDRNHKNKPLHSFFNNAENDTLLPEKSVKRKEEQKSLQIMVMNESESNYVLPLLNYADANLSSIHHGEVLRACHDIIPDVKKAQYHTNWCHIVIVNTAFSELLDNWLCKAKEVKLWDMLNSTVFIGLDRFMVAGLKKRGLKHVALWSNEGFEGQLLYDTAQYAGLMSRRLHLIDDLLRAGVHVFVSEVDQVLFQDPLKAVSIITQGVDFDVVVLQDHAYRKIPCFGFIGIRPTAHTMIAWRSMMNTMDIANQNEQLVFQKLQSSSAFKIKTIWLSQNQFWSGQKLQKSRPPFPTSLVVVHANWVIGLKNKKKLLQEKGLWSPTCNNTF